jgi:hypothetical protein
VDHTSKDGKTIYKAAKWKVVDAAKLYDTAVKEPEPMPDEQKEVCNERFDHVDFPPDEEEKK